MDELKELGIYNYQQVSQSKSISRTQKPSYFKVKNGSKTTSRLNTHIAELNGVEFDHLKV